MRVIGWIGVFHVITIIVWMMVNLIFSIYNPISIREGESLAEAGISFYSNFPGYIGLDHGSKSLVMLLSISIPIGLYAYLRKEKVSNLTNTVALIAGCLGFAFYALSLMLQATTVEYAFKLYRSTEDMYTHSFATLLYEWSMLEGGLSVSIYVIANILIATWIVIHSRSLYILGSDKKLSVFGFLTGILMIVGYLVSWFFLMLASQNMHLFNEAIGLLFLVWILLISIKMIRGKIIY